MENSLNDPNLEELKEDLKKRIAEVAERVELADQQLAIIEEAILEPLEITTEPSEIKFLFFLGCTLVGWIEIGFLPSDFMAAAGRINSKTSANDELSLIGEWQFWLGLCCKELGKLVEAKNYLDVASKDVSLPQGLQLASMQLKAWCYVGLGEYDEADKVLAELRNTLITFVNKWYIEYLHGYVSALRHYGITEIYMPVTLALDINGEIVPLDRGKAKPLTEGVSLTDSTIETLKLAIAERIEPRLLSALFQTKEEIINKMPITHTLEEVSQKLQQVCGDWVGKLTNPGSLNNAEFLYEALKARSWGGVIIEYANAVEAEIKAKLLPGLRNFLMKKGMTLDNIQPNKTDSGGSDIGYAEVVLRTIAKNPMLTNFLSTLPKDTISFLFSELPGSLANLRELRNHAAHGDIMTASEAKEMRKLVLGTPEKAGLLKRLNEISL